MRGKESTSTSHGGVIGGVSDQLSLTLSLDTNVYADGDLLADAQEIANAMRVNGGTGIIQNLLVIDQDDQGIGMDVYILDAGTSWGTENSAVAPSDAVAATILGKIEVAATDFYDLGGVQVAQISNVGLVVKAAAATTSLYAAVVSRGAGTYTASGVILKFGILLD